jgi:hypothetical protein
MLLGFIVGRGFSWRTLALFFAATFVFFSRTPLVTWARGVKAGKPLGTAPRFAILYLLLAAVAGLPLLFVAGLWGLMGFAAAGAAILGLNTMQGLEREDRTATGEIAAILGMTLTAPAALYVTRLSLDRGAALLWLLCVLYFSSSVFYVKMRVAARHEKRPGDLARLRRTSIVYHVAMLAIAAWIGWAALISVLPIAMRALIFAARPGRALNLQRIGWTEVAYSVFFLTVAGAGLRLYS